MKNVIKVELLKQARSYGGDKYQSRDGWVIYIPQHISRQALSPAPRLTITIEEGE